MQEMLEWVRATLPMDLDYPRMIEEKIESLIDEEEKVIMEISKNSYIAGYLDNQSKVDDSMNFPQDYYNEIFNTKEK